MSTVTAPAVAPAEQPGFSLSDLPVELLFQILWSLDDDLALGIVAQLCKALSVVALDT